MSQSYLIIGLGNPGKEYQFTRHNFGFLVVSELAEKYKIKFIRSSKYQGFLGHGNIEGKDVFLLLPQTYMNCSGVSVRKVVEDKEIAQQNLLVAYDDFHIDFGSLRIRNKGSAGGHNGLQSIIDKLMTQEFSRLRLGVGSPNGKKSATDFVLSDFSAREKKQLDEQIQKAVSCFLVFLKEGISQAMAIFNKRNKNEEV
ncbi:MAG: aminoacyl-tRNA hydrolase [Candidatus Omnitrophica bacterium]|nr:aminoacyl-tRNA hydrolase [Candidatus Omnitrophota bacterium]